MQNLNKIIRILVLNFYDSFLAYKEIGDRPWPVWLTWLEHHPVN